MTDSSITAPTNAPLDRKRHRAGVLGVLRHPGALWRFLSDREAPLWPRILAVLTLLYVVMPFDAIPDVIPVIGWLDDIGAVTLALGFITARAAKYIDAQPPARIEARSPQ